MLIKYVISSVSSIFIELLSNIRYNMYWPITYTFLQVNIVVTERYGIPIKEIKIGDKQVLHNFFL